MIKDFEDTALDHAGCYHPNEIDTRRATICAQAAILRRVIRDTVDQNLIRLYPEITVKLK